MSSEVDLKSDSQGNADSHTGFIQSLTDAKYGKYSSMQYACRCEGATGPSVGPRGRRSLWGNWIAMDADREIVGSQAFCLSKEVWMRSVGVWSSFKSDLRLISRRYYHSRLGLAWTRVFTRIVCGHHWAAARTTFWWDDLQSDFLCFSRSPVLVIFTSSQKEATDRRWATSWQNKCKLASAIPISDVPTPLNTHKYDGETVALLSDQS